MTRIRKHIKYIGIYLKKLKLQSKKLYFQNKLKQYENKQYWKYLEDHKGYNWQI